MKLNEEFEAARREGERHEVALAATYLTEIRRAGRTAAARFKERATLLAAASWHPPEVSDVMAFAVEGDRIRAMQHEMVAAISQRASEIPGVSFSALQPPSQALLDKLGARATALAGDLRTPVSAAIAEGWAKGYSVPQTAALIRGAVYDLAPARATMLARTDLISLSNGVNQQAVGLLNAAAVEAGNPPPVQSKMWLATNDDRTRPSHAEADGQEVPFDQPYEVGGAELMYPGDPDGPDEEVINCRCTELYTDTPASIEGTDAESPEVLDDLVSGLPEAFFGQVAVEVAAVRKALSELPSPASMKAKLSHLPDGKLPVKAPLTIEGAWGNLRYRTDSETGEVRAIEIGVSRSSPHPGMTYLHELGHFYDLSAFGTLGFASESAFSATRAFARLVNAIEETAEVRLMRARVAEYRDRHARIVDLGEEAMREHAELLGALRSAIALYDYYLDPAELFARAFAQWSATKYGGPLLRRELQEALDEIAAGGPRRIPDQWTTAEFKKIEKAMDELLREAGLTASGLQVTVRLFTPVVRGEPLASEGLVPPEVLHEPGDDLGVRETILPRGEYVEHVSEDTRCGALGERGDKGPPGELYPRTRSDKEERMATATAARWISDVAFEGLATGDGRYMAPDSLRWRDPPLTLMAMIETPETGGHSGAQVAGRMDAFSKDAKLNLDGDPLPAGVTAIRAVGAFDLEGERGGEVARMVSDETMRGISVDLAVFEWAFRDPESGALIDPDEASDEEWERAFMGEYEFAVLDGEIMAATVCPTPAFADARIAILASGVMRPNVWRAGTAYAEEHGLEPGQIVTTLYASMTPGVTDAESHRPPLVSAAAPLAPPLAWFQRPEPNGPMPLTITEEGAVYGHLALWDTCHTGFLNGEWSQCVRAPRSPSNYAYFHVGELRVEEGDLIPIGKLTFDTGHASLSQSALAARSHYDDTGAVGAFVRAKDGQHGIWVCGALRSNITPEGLRDLRANPLSGDWRAVDHRLDLIAALAVPVPGFPVPRSQLALSASASGELEVTALILSAVTAGADPITDPGDGDGRSEYEGEALAAFIEGGADGLAALIEGDG